MKPLYSVGVALFAALSCTVHADDYNYSISGTLDNDSFVGEDTGYTNGVSLALYEYGGLNPNNPDEATPEETFWVTPLMWSMPRSNHGGAINAYSIGQSMFTPDDITVENPDPDDVPYSAALTFTNTYITVGGNQADAVHTTVGIVGPAALGEQSQKTVHKIMGADDPKGWDYQLHNEPVFQVGRGRVWRQWATNADDFDVLTTAYASAGTLRSSVNSSVMVRYGRDLENSYPSLLLMSTRTSNPIAVEKEWYVYAELKGEYVFNQIFTDGNTFRNSRSMSDYERDFVGLNLGASYSWGGGSITFAINHSDLMPHHSEQYQNRTQYGTLTLAFDI
ncbi:lipid A deacylase LpxR family protein [Marinomonas ostreistagni]|uniref:lipid A deacylase LpxR family protein n=1 Tax=Marinomonas ostreistagni TaxID=359209 RepID=UPI00195116B8|nr:lipid A deacylase LpxR family protein [Marinomonas ostreistagni]MBM6549521.1 lipid A deacylase LpxR family protein [Marinomonas ostreistagni]